MTLKYEPGLDGVRALAALCVVATHSLHPLFPGGERGVDVFFVLSGFLITRLLRDELLRNHRIDYAAFMLRRMRRLYPALLFMLGGVVIGLTPFQPGILWEVAAAALYVSNFVRAFGPLPTWLTHTWSLGLEFQFYLLWPLIFAVIMRGRWPVVILIALYVIATMAGANRNLHPGGLILGAAVAFLPRLPGLTAIPALIALAGVMALHLPIMWAELAGAVLVSAAGNAPVLAWGPLPFLGKISYALYLWHFSIAQLLYKMGLPPLTNFAVTLGLGLSFACLSWHLIERRRVGPTAAPATALAE
jgi:peptidoglycan/LPS O-acetylase OafA/YrhL